MTWRDNLRPASFRGVPFEVLSADRDLGRKIAVHDYPLRDISTGEDMGRVPGSFSLDAFVIGDDYMARRDALEAAFDTAGTGPLIVPWAKMRTVRLLRAQATESSAEGGMCRYRLDFMVEEALPPPIASVDTTAAVISAAQALQTTADTALSQHLKVADQLNFVVNEASSVVGRFSDQLDTLTAPLKAAATDLDGFIANGLALRSQVMTLLLTPADLAASVSGLIQGVRTIAATPSDALKALISLLGFGDDLTAVNPSTPSRQSQADNQAALISYVRQTAAAEAIQAVNEIAFVAYDDAISTRDTVAELMDEAAIMAADAGDGDAWRALSSARQAMIADVTARGGSLARLYAYTPPVSLPALVLAYRLYSDISQVEAHYRDIVARNDIINPVCIRGGLALEVLNDL